jgi:hypothetical protein
MAKSTATETETPEVTDGAAAETVDESTTVATGVGGSKFNLPAGKVTPIQLKNELVKRGHAPADIKPQQFYTFVKNPGKQDPFPVKHYDEDGIEYDTAQVNPGETRAWTRPGLDMEAGVEWFLRRKERTGTSGKPGGTSGKPRDGQAPAAAVDGQVTTDEPETGEFEEAE